jgi:hypothetical protein
MALRIDEKGKFHGVLADWDLATIKELGEHQGDRRTGTVPFMALDALCDEFWIGKIPRVYHHELEGHIWVLPWVFFQYQDKQYTSHRMFKPWLDREVFTVRAAKRVFNDEVGSLLPRHTPRECWQEQWPLVPYTMYTLTSLNLFRQRLVRNLKPASDNLDILLWIQLPDTKKFTTIQLEYLTVWKNIARSLPREKADKCQKAVDLDVDIHDDTMLEPSYLNLFAEPDPL